MEDLDVAIAAAVAGGDIIAAGFGRHTTTDFKGHNDPVTEIDRDAEKAIIEILRRHRPDDGLLGEEGTDVAGRGPSTGATRRWLIDPLDGTVNFVHGFPQVSVSIGLWDDDQPRVGVVLDPIGGQLFTAVAGGGAHLNGEPIRVSKVPVLSHALLVTGFPYDRHEHGDAYLATVSAALRACGGLRRLGSAALDLAYVAAGRIDGSWEYSLAPWDIAAGIIILTEAGGTATTPDGSPVTPYVRHIVTSNGNFHEELRRLVADTFPPHLG